ncbi:phosphoglycerate kinase [Elysia marginata]|uniref:Phosphoglycerate kinase n=1 Tax=Elysia marginata TaxID=1093978 RepID=A0AAV4IP13_9GAST|nr:phosphoglycerate kinase [Elysia marginata]
MISSLSVCPAGYEIVDIGPHTRQCFIDTIREAAAVLWLGDFGPLTDGTEAIKEAYLNAAKSGTPTYAADDTVKKVIGGVISKPEECLFVTGDGETTENLLRGHIPKGISVLSKFRRKVKREAIPEEKSLKPDAYELPGMAILGGARSGQSYGASHSLLCINHVRVENTRVVIRVEFNEPMTDSVITNNYRMRMTIPTIKVILFQVIFVPRTVGKDVMTTINVVHPGSVLMVENVRFHPEEEQGFMTIPDGCLQPMEMLTTAARYLPAGYAAEMNAQFCEELSRLGDIYVNDAFGALHLDHASITGNFRPTRVCGFLVKNELKYLAKLLNYPNRKFLVILGGTKLEDKLNLLPGIFKEADSLILAGTMACLFLKVEHGLKTGDLNFNKKLQDRAREMVKLAAYHKCRMHYPVDLAVSQEGPAGEKLKQTTKLLMEAVYSVTHDPEKAAMTIIGGRGLSQIVEQYDPEHEAFTHLTTGTVYNETTKLLMEAVYSVTHDPEKAAMTIIGGRGLSQIVEQYDPEHEAFTHLTTGGRTALELLASRHVVGLNPLLPKPGKRPLSLLGTQDYTEFRDAIVLVRCDLDLPMDDGVPLNTFPLQHLVETVKYIQKKGATAVILVSQRGHPDGQVIESLSLLEIKPILENIFDQPVLWKPDALSPDGENPTSGVQKGAIILAENIGFQPAEAGFMTTETGLRVPVSHEDINAFRGHLRVVADVFVNESFATIHRAYSSVVGISRKPCISGQGLKKQIYDYIDIRRQMDGNFLLILGAEVVEEIFPQLLLLYHVLETVDSVFLCGQVSAVFHSGAANSSVKQYRDAQLLIPRILHKSRLNKVTLTHVTDTYAAKDPSDPDEDPRVVHVDSSVPRGYTRCDMGPTSVNNLTSAIKAAKLIVLCGPTGGVQYEHHQRGTKGVLDQIAAVTAEGPTVAVALGMRTGQFIHHLGHVETFHNYSVQAEPFFDILSRRPLAGLQVLDRMPVNALKKLSMEQMSLSGKRVLMRLDLDVPSVEGVVLDTDKLEDAAPSIMYALNQGAKCVVLLGHRGEPLGYKNYYLRMEPLVVEISAILGMEVSFIDRPCSKKAKKLLADPPAGSVFLMENLKFYPAEMGQDAEPRKFKSTKRNGDSSLTGLSEISKDEPLEESVLEAQETEEEEPSADVIPEEEEEEDSVSEEALSVSDGEGGLSVDSLMYQLMRPKTVEQFVRDLAACGDVFINDDVAHVEEPLTSFAGFGLAERGCGLLLAEFLKDSEEAGVYHLPGVENLSPAP